MLLMALRQQLRPMHRLGHRASHAGAISGTSFCVGWRRLNGAPSSRSVPAHTAPRGYSSAPQPQEPYGLSSGQDVSNIGGAQQPPPAPRIAQNVSQSQQPPVYQPLHQPVPPQQQMPPYPPQQPYQYQQQQQQQQRSYHSQPYQSQPYQQQPYQQQQSYQQQPASVPRSAPPPFPQPSPQSSQGGQVQARQPEAAAPAPAQQGNASRAPLQRVNPGKIAVNNLVLMGTLIRLARQERTLEATIQVPYATKSGFQEFHLQAWDELATQMEGLDGVSVIVTGRLDTDRKTGGTKVVAKRVQIVDPSLPVTYSSWSAGSGLGAGAAPRSAVGAASTPRKEPKRAQEIWKLHYETQTQSIQALASHFGKQPKDVLDELLGYAFESRSPLRYRALALEYGLGIPGDPTSLSFTDFIGLVAEYREDMERLVAGAASGSNPMEVPVTLDGRLKVKPMREWALAQPEDNLNYFAVKEYESRHGLQKTYQVLQMAVVAEATTGVWPYDMEFGPRP